MELSRMAPSLLLIICGDVEPNPGPYQETPARSEVIRKFTRCIQSDLVKLMYEASNENPPTHLYEKDPPGWSSFDMDIKFENICNVQKGGPQIFDKLIKLIEEKVRKIPNHILDVINCYKRLSHPKMRRKSAEADKLKETLENYISKSKVMKHSEEILKTMNESFLIDVLRRGTELARQGSLPSPAGLNNVLDAINDLINAVEQTTEEKLPTGKKRSLSIDNQEAAYKIKQMKKRKGLSACRFAGKGKVMSKGKSRGGKKNGKIVAQFVGKDVEPHGSERLSTITENNGVEQNNSTWGFQGETHHTNEFYTQSQLESPPHSQGVLDDLFPDITSLLHNSYQNESSSDYWINPPVTKDPVFNIPVEISPVDSTSLLSYTTIDGTVDCDTFPQDVDSTFIPSIESPPYQSQSIITDQLLEQNPHLYSLSTLDLDTEFSALENTCGSLIDNGDQEL
ncbi:uncharacterized protein LOC130050362 isoform X2 [Ostrea edulis]|uniref:uncharacterized protein LOC130050362 isoform X2 n=1 Tax=Ostrea edulis TaxID=37623 RepID=UPI0024AF79F8|nr:uncharacterized protein LOC130050362 isoform X2 [Ostrea edulis]